MLEKLATKSKQFNPEMSEITSSSFERSLHFETSVQNINANCFTMDEQFSALITKYTILESFRLWSFPNFARNGNL